MTGYKEHYHKARQEFINWYYSKHHPEYDKMCQLRSMMMDDEEMCGWDSEFQYVMDSFDDCIQVKILWHNEIKQHTLKIKWEHSPWWNGQVLHFYYCVMLPIDNVEFKTPYQLARGEEE